MRLTSLLFILCVVAPAESRAQSRETFDLVTLDVPAAWTKQVSDRNVQFTLQEPAAGSAIQLSIFASVPGTADPKENFTTAWDSMVATTVSTKGPPKLSTITRKNGWSTLRGEAPYELASSTGMVTLVTSTGFGTVVSIGIVTNNPKRYAKTMKAILASVTLAQPAKQEPATPVAGQSPPAPAPASAATSLIGTWGRGSSVTSAGGSFGRYRYTKQQYTFDANGTYSYVRKNYVEDDPETYLTREAGTYSVSGDTITIAPKTSVIEAWSKSNGGDNYKQRLSSQKQPLEKVTYRWTIAFFAELKESDLVLLADKETVRDGSYNATEAFPKGWRLSPTSLANPSYTAIKLP